MDISTLTKRHPGLISLTIAVLLLSMGFGWINGIPEPFSTIAWLDVTGEGSIAVLSLLWILAALASRPPGKVTTLMVVGLNCFLFSATLDLLDEFYFYPTSASWLSMVESIPAAVGMIVMTLALFYWHKEQLALNRQLQRREWWYRSHEDIDPITQLYRGDYWRERALSCQAQGLDAAIIILDIDNFSEFNLRYGQLEGDRFLKEIGHLLVMNLRDSDLACRYAGDRFVILMPQMCEKDALLLANQICRSIRYLAFRCNSQTTAVFNSARSVTASLKADECLPSLLTRLNQQLDSIAKSAA